MIRRVTGMTVGEYFRDLVADPLGADAWIGLPAPGARVAHMQVGPTLAELIRQQAAARTPDVVDWSDRAMTLGGAWPPSSSATASASTTRSPGGGDSRSRRNRDRAGAGHDLVGDRRRDRRRSAARRCHASRRPGCAVRRSAGVGGSGAVAAVGHGIPARSEARRYLTPYGFGHDGAGGQVAFADPDSGIGFAFLTNQMEAIDDVRATDIVDALRKILD